MSAGEWAKDTPTKITGGVMSRSDLINFNSLKEKSPFLLAFFHEMRSEVEAEGSSDRRLGLILALVLSLGLWAIIWVVVAALIGRATI
jgi:hypothetical protein